MNRFISAPKEDTSAIDLTPMLDVVFIMLIFFVVTAIFVKEAGISIAPAGEQYAAPDDIASISVLVDRDGVYRVNERIVTRGNLMPYLYAVRSENPDAGFGLVLAAESSVADAVYAADSGRRLGYDVIPVTRQE